MKPNKSSSKHFIKHFKKNSVEVFNFVKNLNAKHRHGGEVSVSELGQFVAREFHFGQLGHHSIKFSAHQLIKLNQDITQLTGSNPAWHQYPKQTRVERSKNYFDIKTATRSVTEDFVIVNCLGQLKVNQQVFSLPTINSLGAYYHINDFKSIEHRQLILVENFAVMASLAQLKLPADIEDPLFIYRGDVKPEQNTNAAYNFFRRWSSSHQLICFSDFDPAGMVIASGSGATSCLIPAPSSWDYIFTVELEDEEINWGEQQAQKKTIDSRFSQNKLGPELMAGFSKMAKHKRTWQQEHMISHETPLQLITLHACADYSGCD